MLRIFIKDNSAVLQYRAPNGNWCDIPVEYDPQIMAEESAILKENVRLRQLVKDLVEEIDKTRSYAVGGLSRASALISLAEGKIAVDRRDAVTIAQRSSE